MFSRIYNFLSSLTLGLWLMGGIMVLLAIGSFSGGERSTINQMPLFTWLGEAPLAASWWLWGALGLLALMALNTVLCSIETLRKRHGQSGILMLAAPQLMHLGFLLIIVAHLLSAKGGAKETMQVYEGSSIAFPGGGTIQIGNIEVTTGPMGMPTDLSAAVRSFSGPRQETATVRPNAPVFHEGFGIYLKEATVYPFPAALIEIHREPGAGWALAGALLFTAGNVALLAVKRGR